MFFVLNIARHHEGTTASYWKKGLQKRADHHTVQERFAFPRLGDQRVSSPTTCRTRRPSAAREALTDLENVTQNGTSQHTVVIRVFFNFWRPLLPDLRFSRRPVLSIKTISNLTFYAPGNNQMQGILRLRS